MTKCRIFPFSVALLVVVHKKNKSHPNLIFIIFIISNYISVISKEHVLYQPKLNSLQFFASTVKHLPISKRISPAFCHSFFSLCTAVPSDSQARSITTELNCTVCDDGSYYTKESWYRADTSQWICVHWLQFAFKELIKGIFSEKLFLNCSKLVAGLRSE